MQFNDTGLHSQIFMQKFTHPCTYTHTHKLYKEMQGDIGPHEMYSNHEVSNGFIENSCH